MLSNSTTITDLKLMIKPVKNAFPLGNVLSHITLPIALNVCVFEGIGQRPSYDHRLLQIFHSSSIIFLIEKSQIGVLSIFLHKSKAQ